MKNEVDGVVEKRHAFVVLRTGDEMCHVCKQSCDLGPHYTKEDIEKILERRRSIMPDYDKRLEEWLS